MQDLVAALELEHHDQKGCVLIGASFGGLLASALARRLQARALVLLNPLPPAPFQPPPQGGGDSAQSSLLRRWGLDARLAGTQAALPELRGGEALLAFRRWRDFSGALLAEAQSGYRVEPPDCPLLVVQSEQDEVIDPRAVEAMVTRWRASHLRLRGSHVSPLLGNGWWASFEGVRAWLAALD
ncbi:Alpha/beta hydrolase family protein [Aquimonas voraii]|uniref:Alpha/beta hydrolase family protein n=2 Tax=Aquimonas voraii TaxID=265719 RepID=A0A1G6RWC5_9GAMM|nr:Alpha/beta hydrolase family protein [Aquimonas voraii]